MPYDPFAPQPVATPLPVVVPPLTAPDPTLAANNALAQVADPTAVPTVVMPTTAPAAGGPDWAALYQQYQANPQAFTQGMPSWFSQMGNGVAGGGWGGRNMLANVEAFRSAKQDWRSQRPTYDPATEDNAAFRSDIQDWRSQRPTFRDYRSGIPAGAPGTGGTVVDPGNGTNPPGNTGIVPPTPLPPISAPPVASFPPINAGPPPPNPQQSFPPMQGFPPVNTKFPLNPGAGGPIMTPGGGLTGAPLQGPSASTWRTRPFGR